MNKFKWTCKYCGHEHRHITDEHIELLYCDAEEGGCDKLSVVIFSVETFTTVLKVEGEGEAHDAERELEILEGGK